MTGGEEYVVLGVESESAGAAALAVESISRGYFERLSVHRGDLVLIFQIDPYVAVAVGNSLFRRTAQVERAHDRAILGVDNRGVGGAVAEYPDALVERVEKNAVGATLHRDGLDYGQRVGIPHGYRVAAGKAMTAFGVDRGAAGIGVGNLAHEFERVEIVDRDPRSRTGARHI